MGSYMSQPSTEKESATGRGPTHSWGSSCMQGWRTSMEDAHVTIPELVDDLAFFGVFDGHGGREVAAFCEKHMPDALQRNVSAVRASTQLCPDTELRAPSGGSLGQALRQSFHEMDDMLRSPEWRKELTAFRRGGLASDSSGEEGASSSDGDGAGASTQQPRVVSFLETSIKADLAQARDKGSLTKDEASQVMMKMALLKRLRAQADAQPEAPASDTAGAENVGCTAVCILLWQTGVICANAGDSRAVLCRKGCAVELSHDHKPNDDPERRRIEAAGGYVEEIPVGPRVHFRVNGNLNLSRAIGDLEYKKQTDLLPEQQIICSTPDIVCQELTEDDEFIVLACDGVWDVKSNQEVCDFVGEGLRAGRPIEEVIEMLLDDCIAGNLKESHGLGGDNMTCVVVRLGTPEDP